MTDEEVDRFVAEARKRWDSPRRGQDGDPDRLDYCVGGALCRHMVYRHDPKRKFTYYQANSPFYFPLSSQLAVQLSYYNPRLDRSAAYAAACDITYRNDMGEFDAAWEAVRTALRYRKETTDDTIRSS